MSTGIEGDVSAKGELCFDDEQEKGVFKVRVGDGVLRDCGQGASSS
jgi:hypothetical protein